MKRYKVEYQDRDKSRFSCLTEISKSGRFDGIAVRFWHNEKKVWQDKFKNGTLNGFGKYWLYSKTKNNSCLNWKKGNAQGIRIVFK